MCGLMPGYKETSEQLQMVVGLLSGMVEDDNEECEYLLIFLPKGKSARFLKCASAG